MRPARAPAVLRCKTSPDRRHWPAGGFPAYQPVGRVGLRYPVSFVDQFRIFQDGIDSGPDRFFGGAIQAAEKTAFAASMAGNAAFLAHLEQNDVAIAVQADFVHDLNVAGFLAFAPQAVA